MIAREGPPAAPEQAFARGRMPAPLRVALWVWRAEGSDYVSPALAEAVKARDGHRCLRCGAAGPLEIDHVWPWSRGGPTKLSNLQTLCRHCNRWKGDWGRDYRPRRRLRRGRC